eukprot:10575928-Heterocapsa_arctica.AAC.1
MLENVVEDQNWSQAQMLVQNYKRSARNIMVIARMPEDRSKTVKKLQSHIHLYAYTCRAH